MSTMQTPLHPVYLPSLLPTRQPQLSFCPSSGPSLPLPQGLCTGCSYPLVHPSLSSSHSQTFPVIHILLKYHLLRKKVPDNPIKKTHSHNPTFLSSKPLLVSEIILFLHLFPYLLYVFCYWNVSCREKGFLDCLIHRHAIKASNT